MIKTASFVLASCVLSLACSVGGTGTAGTESGGSHSGASGPGGAGGTQTNSGGSGAGFTTGGTNPMGTGGFEECTGVTSTATAEKQPADIIIAVDTSGSMSEESAEVQANLNNFAALISASGIDVHVVLIADANVCIPAPLGSGSCGGADEKLPGYRHVVQTVNSTDAFDIILATHSQWAGVLRPNATKTILVVTDDNSDMSASSFAQSMVTTDPTFQGFKFDAIYAYTSPLACFGFQCPMNNPCCHPIGPFGCESYAAEEGTVYRQLVTQTMGVQGDLCAQDFDTVFQDMATGVIVNAQLSCEYPIPEPPMGETLDVNKVNVLYTPGGSMTPNPVYYVPGGAADCGPMGGWYFDNPAAPTTIHVCPATCTTLQGDAGGKVDVEFGCKTEIVPS